MEKRLNWLNVLNEQTRWYCRDDMKAWLTELVGRHATVLDGTVDGFEEALGYMRAESANLHFGLPVDLVWLDTQLKTVTLGLLHHQGAQAGPGARLPYFRAKVKGMHDTDLLRAVKDTLLVQFADFLGDCLDAAQCAVSRCEGVYRITDRGFVAAPACYSGEMEERWRKEIRLSADSNGSTHELQRCANLFVGNGKMRFCSDACRFATFQIEKRSSETNNVVDKPRRYRRRQELAQELAFSEAAATGSGNGGQ